jgi:hypothetical protein
MCKLGYGRDTEFFFAMGHDVFTFCCGTNVSAIVSVYLHDISTNGGRKQF